MECRNSSPDAMSSKQRRTFTCTTAAVSARDDLLLWAAP